MSNTLARYTMLGNWAVKDANGKAYIGREVDNFITCQNGKIRSLEADLEVMDNRVAYLNAHNKDLGILIREQESEITKHIKDKTILNIKSFILLGTTIFLISVIIYNYIS